MNLPLLSFQHHVGCLYIDPEAIEFVCELGIGDLAVVEQGRWQRSDGSVCSVVVKGYKPFVVENPQDFRELLLEASKLHRLSHPNITRFLGLGCFSHGSLAEVRESMFMVEEYVGTRTLRKLIGEQMRCRYLNLYSMQAAIRWATEVAAALAALHEQHPPYIHGDVKADNVFLTDGHDPTDTLVKLGDLKPHRHVYDREPSTLSKHQQYNRQSSLARFTLERSSSCNASAVSGISAATDGERSPKPRQQQRCSFSTHFAASSQQQPQCFSVQTAGQAVQPAASDDFSLCSANRPGVALSLMARAASLPSPLNNSLCEAALELGHDSAPETVARHALQHAAKSGTSSSSGSIESSSSEQQQQQAEPGSASGVVVFCQEQQGFTTQPVDVVVKPGSASKAAAGAVEGGALAVQNNNQPATHRRRSSNCRPVCLSDSASSTTSNGGSGLGCANGHRSAVGIVSLAAAEDDEHEQSSSDGQEYLEADQDVGRRQQQQQQQQQEEEGELQQQPLQEASRGASWDCSAHGSGLCQHMLQHVAQDGQDHHQQQQQQHRQRQPSLLRSLLVKAGLPHGGAPAVKEDIKVHNGSPVRDTQLAADIKSCVLLEGKQERLVQSITAAGELQQGLSLLQLQQHEQQPKQQQQQSAADAASGWELSSSGALSPCGTVQSSMLDLFADMEEEQLVFGRRSSSRGEFQRYTMAPGSFVQQRVQSPTAASSASVLLKASHSWSPSSQPNVSPFALSTSSSAHSAVGPPQQQLQQQQQLDAASSLRSGTPAAIESKQHGGNSALAALTAMDSIREESSSVATDSVVGSRESTAHGGSHYFNKDATGSFGSLRDQQEDLSGRWRSKAGPFSGLLHPRTSVSNGSTGQDSLLGTALAGGGSHSLGIRSCSIPEQLCLISDPSSAGIAGGTALDRLIPAAGELDCSLYHSLSAEQLGTELKGVTGLDAAVSAKSAALDTSANEKRVRFAVERAAGSTPSRDYGLLYAAPELLKGQRPTEKVDVFAFGVLLYELFSRSLVVAQCSAALSGSRKGAAKHGSRHPRMDFDPSTASADPTALPEQQLLLAYAQVVAAGYRPPFPRHFPEPVCTLISACWAAEPHERPRMSEVLAQLETWQSEQQLIAVLDSYLAGYDDIGYRSSSFSSGAGSRRPSYRCGCTIS